MLGWEIPPLWRKTPRTPMGTVQALGGAPLALEEVPLGLEGTAPSLDFWTVFADLAVGGVAKEELPLAGLEEN